MAEDEQMNDQVKEKWEIRIDFIRPLDWSPIPKSKLILIVRTGGEDKSMCRSKRKLLYSLRLRKLNTGVLVKADETIMLNLRKLEPFVKYGYPPLETVKTLICNTAAVKIGKRITLLEGNNNVVEEVFGRYNIFCIQDVVNEIANVGPHFNNVATTIVPFLINREEGKKKRHGRLAGNREDHIALLISKIKIT
ncbi:hypothetical protein LIER_21792 [Lithospermum erythrorhizon]|uniref:Ribosomal protein L30 n=1 Tax=Lithospermum erythrorhizon TaxID=34254 RepID=A0AAV3QX85_LITER